MHAMIQLDAVSKIYRKGMLGKSFHAIDDVSFSVAPSEAVGFIGHNGAGKSTAIRILMGLQRPSAGTVLLQGLSPLQPESRRHVAYVPENPLLYDHLTPNELLTLALVCHGVARDEIPKRCDKWLARLGLAEVANKRVRQFSKGMVQRSALAMALCVEPKLLVLDEPLSGLDPSGRREVVEILSEYRVQGGSMLFSSHVLTDVEVLADRFLFIHRGKIRVNGTPGALLGDESESFEIIIEADISAPEHFSRLYGRQYKCEVSANDLEHSLAALRKIEGVRLINIRSRNTLESAYFRFMDEANRASNLVA